MIARVYPAALLFGVVAGLRAFTAPAVVAWASHLGRVDVTGTRLSFFGKASVRRLLTVLALGELVGDQLPTIPSRTLPMSFAARLITGSVSGSAIGASDDRALGGALAGLAGAIIGTLGGSRARAWLAGALHNDHPAALIEDAVAIGGAWLTGTARR